MTEPTPVYAATQAAMGSQGQPVESPAPVNPTGDIDAQVAAIVNARLSEVESKYADRISDLEAQLAARPAAVTHNVPENAGGPGLTLAPTWSQHLQELARAGALKVEHLIGAGFSKDAAEKALS